MPLVIVTPGADRAAFWRDNRANWRAAGWEEPDLMIEDAGIEEKLGLSLLHIQTDTQPANPR
jgi:hypothetical protein